MYKLRAYIDTSVIGGNVDKEPLSRQPIAGALLKTIREGEIEMIISTLVLDEINQAPQDKRLSLLELIKELDYEILEKSKESIDLTLAYLQEKALPETSRDDARHIAIATVNNIGIIVSWNFKHMANVRVVHAINAINLQLGYRTIEIVPPEEVLDYGEMGI